MDLVVVGAGLTGLTVAEQAASRYGMNVLVLDRRDHLGGNAYSSPDAGTGIEIHRYGAHIFHTSNERVWEYANRFTGFTDYRHRVYTVHRGTVYPLPVNLGTINQFFGTAMGPHEARALIAAQAGELGDLTPRNFVEKGISLVGRPLYEAFFAQYTAKQWQTTPEDLPASVVARLPVRYTYDNRYFTDVYEGMPVDGYGAWAARLADHPRIEVRLGVDFLADGPVGRSACVGQVPVVYTGPVDEFFGWELGRLTWRTVRFEYDTPATGDFQGAAVMNYADADVPWTRIIEFRHFHPERPYPGDRTVIAREYAGFAGAGDDPYYPVRTPADEALLAAYHGLAADTPGVYFGGRCGTYSYIDMDQAIAAGLALADKVGQN